MAAAKSPEAIFWEKTAVGPDNECWHWQGNRNQKNYGYLRPVLGGRKRNIRAHRFSWEMANGQPIPKGMIVRHLCDNPICVNPKHLLLGTHAENTMDAIVRGRFFNSLANLRNSYKSKPKPAPEFCVRCGHRRTDDYIQRRGAGVLRRCRACVLSRSKARDRVKRSALAAMMAIALWGYTGALLVNWLAPLSPAGAS